MNILDDLFLVTIADRIDATPVDADIPKYEALGANDYKAGHYWSPRGISQEQLDDYRAGFEAAECEDARLEEQWKERGC